MFFAITIWNSSFLGQQIYVLHVEIEQVLERCRHIVGLEL